MLSGEAIPIGARIVAVVDAFDAMTYDRPYRARLSPDEARAELVRHRGTQFDPELVDLLLTMLDEPTGPDDLSADPFTRGLHVHAD
jgi:HD-GYP domain-containing protein (c-di-GMP phosphodiesterase class II)